MCVFFAYQGNSAGRFKAFYYYNTPAAFELVMEVLRPLLNKKFKDRVKSLHYICVKTLLHNVEKSCII